MLNIKNKSILKDRNNSVSDPTRYYFNDWSSEAR